MAKMKILNFSSCKCKHKDPKCVKGISLAVITKCFIAFNGRNRLPQAMKRNYIGGIVTSGVPYSSNCEIANKRQRGQDIRQVVQYRLFGHIICEPAFRFIFNISSQLIKSILRNIKDNSQALHIPLFKGRSTDNPKYFQYRIENFLKRYSEIFGLLCPTAIRKQQQGGDMIRFLPRGTARKDVYQKYMKPNDTDEPPCTLKHFYWIWKKKVSSVNIMRHGLDFCDECTTLQMLCNTFNSISSALDLHREHAQRKREFYYRECEGAPLHLTSDFVQSVHIPYLLRQPGSHFFKVGLTARLFGICCEKDKGQMNYVLPEGSYPCKDRGSGKGANLIISLLYHYLAVYNNNSVISLNADSCAGQNKNRFMFFYLLWRVITGLNEEIKLCFMVTGHTKSTVDGLFGVI